MAVPTAAPRPAVNVNAVSLYLSKVAGVASGNAHGGPSTATNGVLLKARIKPLRSHLFSPYESVGKLTGARFLDRESPSSYTAQFFCGLPALLGAGLPNLRGAFQFLELGRYTFKHLTFASLAIQK